VKKYLEDELSLFKQVLSAIPYLKNYRDESLVFNLYNTAFNRFCHNGDYLYRKGDKMKEEMYIIVKGTVSITLVRRGGEEVNLEIL
jgi:CRP-like cAMP-binding protein